MTVSVDPENDESLIRVIRFAHTVLIDKGRIILFHGVFAPLPIPRMIKKTGGKPIHRHLFKARGNHNGKVSCIINICALSCRPKVRNQQKERCHGYEQTP